MEWLTVQQSPPINRTAYLLSPAAHRHIHTFLTSMPGQHLLASADVLSATPPSWVYGQFFLLYSHEKPGHSKSWTLFLFFFVQMPSGRSFYACKTGGISTKLPGIRPFAFYGKTNRSSRGHIQNDCEKCDGGKFWLPASGCSHVFVPVDENHTDSRADILAQQPCAHVETLQIESALGSREEQTGHAVSHRPCPGWGHSWGTKAACLVWLLAFLSPNLSPKLEGLALIFRALVSMLI